MNRGNFIMSDKIQSSYRSSKNFYDAVITHKTWWSKIYSEIIWKGADNNIIARKLLDRVPDNFGGKILDVPLWFVLLNPVVFLLVGLALRAIKRDWFYDLPSIIMPSLGISMFGVIGIVNLI